MSVIKIAVQKLEKHACDFVSYRSQKSRDYALALYSNKSLLTESDIIEWESYRNNLWATKNHDPLLYYPCENSHSIFECIELSTNIFRVTDIFNFAKFHQNPKFIFCTDRTLTLDSSIRRACMPSALLDWAIQNTLCRAMPPHREQFLPFLDAVYKMSSYRLKKIGKAIFIAQLSSLYRALSQSDENSHPEDVIQSLTDYIIVLQYCRAFSVVTKSFSSLSSIGHFSLFRSVTAFIRILSSKNHQKVQKQWVRPSQASKIVHS